MPRKRSCTLTREFCQGVTDNLCEALRAFSGDGSWFVDPRFRDHDWAGVLKHPDGYRIFLDFTKVKGRVYMSSMPPEGIHHRTNFQEKVVSATLDKHPQIIAKNIWRRLWPDYVVAYKKAVEDSVSREVAHVEKELMVGRFAQQHAKILHAKREPYLEDARPRTRLIFKDEKLNGIFGDIVAVGLRKSCVTLNNLPPSVVRRILNVMENLAKEIEDGNVPN
jgi:hypothetical protein